MPSDPRVALVTGATGGIGLATAAELLRRGIRVLVHGRTRASAEAAVEALRAGDAVGTARAVWADLAVLAEVRALADQVLEEKRLDVLLHNAGVERWERSLTPDGFEQTFAVNHLAPFLLTHLLTPLLARSAPARVVFVSSIVHRWGQIHWDDLDARTWYAPEAVYYQSKLAAALTAQEFARRLAPLGVTVLLAPPGLTRTAFGRDFRGMARWWTKWVGRVCFRRPPEVAAELARVSLEPDFAAASGAYVDRLALGRPADRALVRADQRRLWDESCRRVGLVADSPPPNDGAAPLVLPAPAARTWIRAVVLGELLGFTLTALVAFIALSLGGRPETVSGRVVALVVMTLAGTLEGACLGYFQWRALRGWLPALRARRFVGATIGVAAGGWLLGMSVPLLAEIQGAPAETATVAGPGGGAIAAFAMIFGAIAGALFGAAQGIVLRAHVRGVRWWIAGSTIGWALGLPLAYLAGSLGEDTPSWAQALGLSAAAGLGMGLCVGAATLPALRRMTRRTDGAQRPTGLLSAAHDGR